MWVHKWHKTCPGRYPLYRGNLHLLAESCILLMSTNCKEILLDSWNRIKIGCMASMKVYYPWLAETDHFSQKNPEKILAPLQEAQLRFPQMHKCSCQVADASCLQLDLCPPGRLLAGETVPSSFKYSNTMSSETGWTQGALARVKLWYLTILFASYRLAVFGLHRLMYPSILSCSA